MTTVQGTIVVTSMIVIVAFLGNALVIFVLLRRQCFLRKPYGIFIFNLAVVDCITAIFLTFSRFLYLPPIPKFDATAADVVCKLTFGVWPPFTLGYISIYTCLILTVERWFAVVKPKIYPLFKSRHAILAVVVVWLWGIALNITTIFRVKYVPAKEQCQWVPLPVANDEMPLICFTLQTLLPMSVMVVLYVHIYSTLKKLPNLSPNRDSQLKRVTVVSVAACFGIIIGWLPGRVTFMLSKFDILHAHGSINLTCSMFTFLNSCVNPFLYGIYSPKFRQEYKVVFRKLLYVKSSFRATVAPDIQCSESNL